MVKRKKGKAGRPRLPRSSRRSEELKIPLTEGEAELLKELAANYGEATAAWARRILLMAVADFNARKPPTKS